MLCASIVVGYILWRRVKSKGYGVRRLLPLVIVVFMSIILIIENASHQYSYVSRSKDYLLGKFHKTSGLIEGLDERYQDYDFFKINGLKFKAKQGDVGCYNVLAEDNHFFKNGVLVELVYLNDMCIAALKIYGAHE